MRVVAQPTRSLEVTAQSDVAVNSEARRARPAASAGPSERSTSSRMARGLLGGVLGSVSLLGVAGELVVGERRPRGRYRRWGFRRRSSASAQIRAETKTSGANRRPALYETEGHRFESCRAHSLEGVDSARRCGVLQGRRICPDWPKSAFRSLKPNRTIAQTSSRKIWRRIPDLRVIHFGGRSPCSLFWGRITVSGRAGEFQSCFVPRPAWAGPPGPSRAGSA
jgi:hypothetical protein